MYLDSSISFELNEEDESGNGQIFCAVIHDLGRED